MDPPFPSDIKFKGAALYPYLVSKLSKLIGRNQKVDLKALSCTVRNSYHVEYERKEMTPGEVEQMYPVWVGTPLKLLNKN